jgi:sec-independent protein translocase protein TatC
MSGVVDNDDELDGMAVKSFVGHLDDLRKTIILAAIFVAIGICIAIPLAPYILRVLEIPYYKMGLDQSVALKSNEVGDGLSIAMRVSIWSGLILSMPFVVWVVGGFIFPGLKKNEKHAITRGSIFSVALFALGVWMGFKWTVPTALVVMKKIADWIGAPPAFWRIPGYVSFVLKILLAFGLTFQMPIVLLILGNMGLITSKLLREYRRHVWIGLMVLAMFLTPSDPFTMIMMAMPLIVLYEGCIWMIWAKDRTRHSS